MLKRAIALIEGCQRACALPSWARSAVRSARFVAVTTRKALGRPELSALTAFGRKLREPTAKRSHTQFAHAASPPIDSIGKGPRRGRGFARRWPLATARS